MDVFNNSISERESKTTNQIQESYRILKSHVMTNKQTLDLYKNNIINLQDKIRMLETVYMEIDTLKKYIITFQTKINTIENNIEQNNISFIALENNVKSIRDALIDIQNSAKNIK